MSSEIIRKMFSFKFGQIEVASKDFLKQKHVTDIFMINVNKVELSDRVLCNNGKDWQYIVGYQVHGETVVPLFIKTPKNIVKVYHNTTIIQLIQCRLIFLRFWSGWFTIETFGTRLSRNYVRS